MKELMCEGCGEKFIEDYTDEKDYCQECRKEKMDSDA
jgi:hypothetical protein